MIKVECFMQNITRKIMIYSMAGMMQFGFGAAVVAASPLYNDGSQQIVQLDDRHDQENVRHEREMRRHDGENDRDWHERQDRENRRHEQFR
jgi:hypothetical protein